MHHLPGTLYTVQGDWKLAAESLWSLHPNIKSLYPNIKCQLLLRPFIPPLPLFITYTALFLQILLI